MTRLRCRYGKYRYWIPESVRRAMDYPDYIRIWSVGSKHAVWVSYLPDVEPEEIKQIKEIFGL